MRVGNLPQKLKEAHDSLSTPLTREQDAQENVVLDAQIRMTTKKLYALERQWEIFWSQRAQDQWMHHGSKGNRALMAAKIDLASAYDSVEWDSLMRILNLMRFPARWISWVRHA
ncbi:hypothetical protein QJS10_CPB12g00830 [Acorus calamus]|uniref:Reverse transcriptase domain-containing protein n=1 Tax=Acorus calamus TaxID=4465 RepID=A0AAV9DJN5_ACOCL|nr:hypothetical protein QJS10_CPB12g00830 [Acorus calamus]